MKNNHSQCPVETTLKAIGGRWKLLILRELFRGSNVFRTAAVPGGSHPENAHPAASGDGRIWHYP